MTIQEVAEMLSKRGYSTVELEFIKWMIEREDAQGKMSHVTDAEQYADDMRTRMEELKEELKAALAVVSNMATTCKPQGFLTCYDCGKLTTPTDKYCMHCGKEVTPF